MRGNKKKISWFKRFLLKLRTQLTRLLWKGYYPTKEDWARVNKIDWEALLKEKYPHDTDPLNNYIPTTSYCSFSGVDTKFYLIDPVNNTRRSIPQVQGCSFVWNPQGGDGELKVRGTIIACLFNKSAYLELIEKDCFSLIAADEFGHMARTDIKGFEITKLSYGIGIDDLVTEEVFEFIAKDLTPWYVVSGPLENLK